MTNHFYPNGKKACRLDPINKVIEIAYKGCKAEIKFNSDGTATVINYDDKACSILLTLKHDVDYQI
jgi:hypothetical protein